MDRAIAERRSLAAILDYAGTRHRNACGLLIAVALIAFLPGLFTIPVVDRDEARYAQSARQMVESGDYVDIRFQDSARYKKPPGIYWMQAAAVNAATVLGVPDSLTKIGLYRLPSLLGACGAVLLTYWAALSLASRRGSLLAGLMMAGSVLLGVEARLATTDAVLLSTVIAAMGAMARVYRNARGAADAAGVWILPGVFWSALAAGILIKGPVIVIVVSLAAGALSLCDRSAAWLMRLRPLGGVAWLLLLALPWLVAISHRSGGAFFAASLGQDLLAKVMIGQESHGAPPGYHALLFWAGFWPGSTLAVLAAPAAWRSRHQPGTRFLLAWLIPSWILFEIVATKLPHYVLPLYPAVAILVGEIVASRSLIGSPRLERGVAWWVVFPLLTAGTALTAWVLVAQTPGFAALLSSVTALTFGLLAWARFRREGAEGSLLLAIVASAALSAAVYAAIIPSFPALFPGVTLARVVRDSGCLTPRVVAAGYEEPSLVFLFGTGTRFVDGQGAAEFLTGGPCRFAILDQVAREAFSRRARSLGLHSSRVATVAGFNFSKGQAVSLSIDRSAEP